MTYEEAQRIYQQLLLRYSAALIGGAGGALLIFEDARSAWRDLSNVAPPGTPEAGAPEDGHFLLWFSYAVAAGHKQEAQRVYELLSEEYRRAVDGQDAVNPGMMKIWLAP